MPQVERILESRFAVDSDPMELPGLEAPEFPQAEPAPKQEQEPGSSSTKLPPKT